LEPWDRGDDDWPWWHWDPRGSIDGRTRQSLVWDPGTKGSIHGWVAQRHGNIQWFVWDLGISPQLHRTGRLADRYGLFDNKQSWGEKICHVPFSSFLYGVIRMDF